VTGFYNGDHVLCEVLAKAEETDNNAKTRQKIKNK
jgi:hypothetical protein